MGINIIDVKIVTICSKCRKPEDEVSKNKHGIPYSDKEIDCIMCQMF